MEKNHFSLQLHTRAAWENTCLGQKPKNQLQEEKEEHPNLTDRRKYCFQMNVEKEMSQTLSFSFQILLVRENATICKL